MAGKLAVVWFFGALLPISVGVAAEPPPLEAYGSLPLISSMALSPGGDRVAYRLTQGDRDYVLVRDLEAGKVIGGADVSAVKPRDLYFVGEDRVLLIASETAREVFGRKAFENSSAFLLDVAGDRVRELLRGAEGLYPAQTGLGRVVGRSGDGGTLYMPAYTGGVAQYSLFEVDLQRRTPKVIADGKTYTVDWFVDAAGRPFVEEEFDDHRNVHRIWVRGDDGRRLIYEKETDTPSIGVVGLTQERDAVVVEAVGSGSDHSAQYHLGLADGTKTGPYFSREDADIERTLMDLNRLVYGVQYSGFMPTYEFTDAALTAKVRAIQDELGGAAAYLVDWTPDFSRLLFHVSGGWSAGDYIIAGRGFAHPSRIARSRPAIQGESVVPTAITKFRARDGVTIPALVTVQQELVSAGKVPLIVLPHGGPESHDRFGFDWLAQFLASRGYAVLQPEFRGSDGFGRKLTELGRGEWGGRMSTDLDDGVRWLVEDGIADPDRVCVVGASYGGYAALAAGAFSDFAYRCIVSIAGISDLPRMLRDTRSRFGKDHWVLDYWEDQFGSDDSGKEALQAISPVDAADAFRAPVLLVHGKKDTIVEINQSQLMYKALRKAGKDVTFVRLDGEDHYLSTAETRLAALQVIADFVRERL